MNTPTLGVSAETGLDISGVIYNYKAVKEKEDDFTVTVGNKDLDGGYVWKDTENWSNKYGMKLATKFKKYNKINILKLMVN